MFLKNKNHRELCSFPQNPQFFHNINRVFTGVLIVPVEMWKTLLITCHAHIAFTQMALYNTLFLYFFHIM